MVKWLDAVHERRILAGMVLGVVLVLGVESVLGWGINWIWFVVALPLVATVTAYKASEHAMSVGLGTGCCAFLIARLIIEPSFMTCSAWFTALSITLGALIRYRALMYGVTEPPTGEVLMADGTRIPLEFARQCPYDDPFHPCKDCAFQNHPFYAYSAIGPVSIGHDALIRYEPDHVPVLLAIVRDDHTTWLRGRPGNHVTA